MKKIFTAIIAILVLAPTAQAIVHEPLEELYVKAQVNEVGEQKIEIDDMSPYYNPALPEPQYVRIQDVTFEVLEGDYKGTIFPSKNELTGQIFDLELAEGDKVLILLKKWDEETFEGFATDYIRNDSMVIFVILFMIALLVLGKWKGLRALVSLVITVGAVFYILIPYTLQGYDPLWLALGICAIVTIATV